jgi:hypothetical protein
MVTVPGKGRTGRRAAAVIVEEKAAEYGESTIVSGSGATLGPSEWGSLADVASGAFFRKPISSGLDRPVA